MDEYKYYLVSSRMKKLLFALCAAILLDCLVWAFYWIGRYFVMGLNSFVGLAVSAGALVLFLAGVWMILRVVRKWMGNAGAGGLGNGGGPMNGMCWAT